MAGVYTDRSAEEMRGLKSLLIFTQRMRLIDSNDELWTVGVGVTIEYFGNIRDHPIIGPNHECLTCQFRNFVYFAKTIYPNKHLTETVYTYRMVGQSYHPLSWNEV